MLWGFEPPPLENISYLCYNLLTGTVTLVQFLADTIDTL